MNISDPVTKATIVSDFISMVRNPVWTAVTMVANRWGSDGGRRPWSPNTTNPGTNFDGGSTNNRSSDFGHNMLGTTTSEPNPTWPAYENSAAGIQATTNAFFILHTFALKLTRHRLAHGYLRCGHDGSAPVHPPGVGAASTYAYLGLRLTSYRPDNLIWFDPPTMPAPGDTVTAATLNAFMSSLRSSVDAIRSNVTLASDIVGCHSSCHSSCHGSRGRR
jgi:hypothetical protein